MNKNFLIALVTVAVVLAAGGILVSRYGSYTKPQVQPASSVNDTTASISQDLNAVDTGSNLDQQFQSIDQDINGL